jgi:hypothetical protein
MATSKINNVLLGTSLILLITSGVFLTKFLALSFRVGMAKEQIEIFNLMREKSLSITDPEQIEANIEYVENYYPSGTKQTEGSFLDSIVESSRKATIREMRHLVSSER